MNVTVLVDFENDSVRTALDVARRARARLCGACGSTPRTGSPTRRSRACYGDAAPKGVAPELVRLVRAELDAHGFRDVRIVVSGGFDADAHPRVRGRRACPVDSYGVGSSLIRGANDFTADVVVVDGRPCAKVGRGLQAQPAARARVRR